jgi:tetratricopeptide (TPR) repeat protein
MMAHPQVAARITIGAAFLALASCAIPAFANPGAVSLPDSPSLQTAQNQFNAGNYSAAVATLQALIMHDASNAVACYWLGRSYYELHDYDNAIAQGEKSISLDPNNSLYHQWLGEEYGGAADRDRSFSDAKKVKKEFQAAVSLNPSNITARRDLEQYDLDAPWIVGGDKTEALDQVNAIAALDPIQGHLARGAYDRGMKKMDQAESEFRLVLSAKSAPLDAYFDVAEFFERQNMPADLDAAIEAAAKVDPNDPRLAFYRGVKAVLAASDLAAAEPNLKSYLANTPDRSDWPTHAAAREWLGRLYEAQGKNSEAAEQYRAALQLDPKRKSAKARLDKLGKDYH